MRSVPGNSSRPRRLTWSYGLLAAALVGLLVVLEILGTDGATIDRIFLTVVGLHLLYAAFVSRTMTLHAFLYGDQAASSRLVGCILAASFLCGALVFNLGGEPIGYTALAFCAAGGTAAYVVLNACIVPHFRKSGSFSTASFLGDHFDSNSVRICASLVLLAVNAAFIIAGLALAATVLESKLQVTPLTAAIASALLVALCAIFGGMRSVGWTAGPLFVAICMGLAAYLLLPFLQTLGLADPLPATAELRPTLLSDELDSPLSVSGWGSATMMLTCMAGVASLPFVHAAFATARSLKAARMASAWALLFILGIVAVVPVLPAEFTSSTGANGSVLLPLDALTQIVEEMLGNPPADFPQVWSGVVTAGLLAAAIALTSLAITNSANSMSNDIVFAWKGAKADTASRLVVARLAILLMAGGGAVLVLHGQQFVLPGISLALGFSASSILLPLILGIWWKRMDWIAALAGMLGGLTAASLWLYHVSTVDTPWLALDFNRIALPGMAGSLVCMLAANLVHKRSASSEDETKHEALHFPNGNAPYANLAK